MSADASESQCVFCRIVRGEIPATVVLERDRVLAFEDLEPQAPVHLLVIPRRHVESVDALEDDDATLVGEVLIAARDLARQEGLAERGYRLVTNVGEEGGQSVGHMHVHLVGGRRMGWPPG